MSVSVKSFGKVALGAMGALGMAFAVPAVVAQEHDHSAHAHDGEEMAEAAELTDAEIEASRTLFSQYGCGSCHAFADANGYGHIGPSLDGNASLSVEYVNTIVSNGQGAMPSFGGMVDEAELETLARYIVAKKAD